MGFKTTGESGVFRAMVKQSVATREFGKPKRRCWGENKRRPETSGW